LKIDVCRIEEGEGAGGVIFVDGELFWNLGDVEMLVSRHVCFSLFCGRCAFKVGKLSAMTKQKS